MDRSKAEAIIKAHANALKDFLGLTDWVISWKFGTLDVHDMICDTSTHDYKMASVTVDEQGYDDEAQVINGIFHELCHVLHADFQNYRQIGEALHPAVTDVVVRVEQRAWTHAAEGFVLRLEWIWRNHLRALYLDQVTRPEPLRP